MSTALTTAVDREINSVQLSSGNTTGCITTVVIQLGNEIQLVNRKLRQGALLYQDTETVTETLCKRAQWFGKKFLLKTLYRNFCMSVWLDRSPLFRRISPPATNYRLRACDKCNCLGNCKFVSKLDLNQFKVRLLIWPFRTPESGGHQITFE